MPTLYTTNKMIAAAVTTDVTWQLMSQCVDPELESDSVGSMAAVDFANYFAYPIALALFAGLAVWYHAYRTKNIAGISDDTMTENKGIVASTFLGMMGWMVGYYIATEESDMGRWGMAGVAGIASAIPLILYSAYYDYVGSDKKPVEFKNYIVPFAIFALSGFLWSLSYGLPNVLHGVSASEELGVSASLASTAVGTFCTLWALRKYEEHGSEKNKTSSPQL